MSFCYQCSAKKGQLGCFCPKSYPEETRAFKSKSGHLFATAAQAIRSDYIDKIETLLYKPSDLNNHRYIDFIIANLECIAQALAGYPLKKDDP